MEVLTALVILTVGIIAVQQAFIRILGASRYSEEKLLSASLAEKKTVELILSSSYYDDLTRNAAKNEKKAAPEQPAYTIEEISRTAKRNKEDFYFHEVTASSAAGAAEKVFLLTPAGQKTENK